MRPDLLVLSTGIAPAASNPVLSGLLRSALTSDGFFLEAHPKLRPVDLANEGEFLCGLAHSPRFMDETIAQAQAAVGRATTVLSKTHLEIPGQVAAGRSGELRGLRHVRQGLPVRRSDDQRARTRPRSRAPCAWAAAAARPPVRPGPSPCCTRKTRPWWPCSTSCSWRGERMTRPATMRPRQSWPWTPGTSAPVAGSRRSSPSAATTAPTPPPTWPAPSACSIPPNVRIIHAPCTGKIEMEHILDAFHKGIDGVLVAGCLEGGCHFLEGNLRARKRTDRIREMLGRDRRGRRAAQDGEPLRRHGPDVRARACRRW